MTSIRIFSLIPIPGAFYNAQGAADTTIRSLNFTKRRDRASDDWRRQHLDHWQY